MPPLSANRFQSTVQGPGPKFAEVASDSEFFYNSLQSRCFLLPLNIILFQKFQKYNSTQRYNQ